MNIRRAYLGLYWGPRPVSLGAAAAICMLGFDELRGAGFSTFYLKGPSKKEALKRQFVPTGDTVRELLAKGRNRRDSDQSVIDELGYSLSLWSGSVEEESYDVSYLVGSSSKFVKNSLVLNLPARGQFSLTENEAEMRSLLSKLAIVFEPDSTALQFIA